ncbi:HAD family hydrolase [Streptomyces rhizosphaericus]|uniref:HAD-IA family hydrolase n=1 Tax=Streptomyces rhizosphaericus TaxID=114699 RepID=A0A6G4AE49_9ACTN|nr:HAD-IA family hydrolase [Streptomyces rhizosphaericus]NEW71104.1 HAD-IA family hydrolase [Streptomyces rhizosphaericus]
MTDSLKLVIFDLDGVLVDTQDAENGALTHLAHMIGLALTEDEAKVLFSGKKIQDCIDVIEEMAHAACPDGAMAIVRRKCEELVGPSLEPIDGVRYALDEIQVTKCVASNSPRDIIEQRLQAAGIAHIFDGKIFSAYEAGAWKPDPTLFQWAADSCGFSKEECVVIEDSSVGVDAALAAGIRVLLYVPDPSKEPLPYAVTPFSSMWKLPAILQHSLTDTALYPVSGETL